MQIKKLFVSLHLSMLLFLGIASAQPVLLSPSNGATNVILPVTLSWSGAGNYDIEVRQGSPGGTLVYSELASSNVSVILNSPTLNFSTVYYWSISDVNGTTTRNFSTAIAPPAVPSLISPINSALNQPTSLTLTWADGGGGAVEFYHLQVANDAGFTSIVFEDAAIPGVTTSQLVPGLATTTTYYWRVRASNLSGAQVSSFSSSFSFTTLDGVTLDSPTNGATGLTLPISFEWTGAGGPYWIQIVVQGNPWTSAVYDNNGVVVSPVAVGSPNLNYATTYDWRVSSNGGSSWVTGTFSTMDPPNVPILVSPVDGAINQLFSLDLEWADGGGTSVDFYHLQVATSNTFSGGSIVYQNSTIPGINTTQTVSGLLPNTTYYWRVRAINSLSGASAYSGFFAFTTIQVPGTPALILPADGNQFVNEMPYFLWTPAGNAPATHFILQITSDPTFYSIPHVINVPVSGDPFDPQGYQLPTALATGSPYYWRVRGVNTAGNGPFAAPFDFRVAASGDSMPPVPVVSYPKDNDTAYSVSPTLNWYVTHALHGATFELEFRSDNAFTGTPTHTGITDHFVVAPGSPLNYSSIYYYKVRTNRGGTYSLWSDEAVFITHLPNPVLDPVLSWPINNVTVWSNNTRLNWYINGNGTGITYDLQYNTDNDFNGPGTTTINDIAANNQTIPTVGIGTTYYWRVRSKNGITAPSNWTAPETFRLSGWSGSAVPIASTPLNGHTVFSSNVTLSWYLNEYSGGYTYNLQYSTDGDWNNPVTTTTVNAHPDRFYALTGLTHGQLYYWRVQSVAGATTSSWSTTASFTVVGPNGSNIPIPSWPTNSVSVPSADVILLWYLNGPITGLIFDVELTTTGVFTGTPTHAGLTVTQLPLTGLANGANYFWRVRSRSINGVITSPWSSIADFIVLSGLLSPVPRIGSPDEDITVFTSSPNISWYVLTNPNGAKYEVEYSTNSSFYGSTVVSNLSNSNLELANLNNGVKYYWRVRSKNNEGIYSDYSKVATFTPDGTSSTDGTVEIPQKFEVAQNYPNPFNPSTVINFGIPERDIVTAKVYDILGREIRTLLNEEKEAGVHSLQWNGNDNFGQKVTSGTYILRVTAGSKAQSIKMLLMK